MSPIEAAARALGQAWWASDDCPGEMYAKECDALARAAVTAFLGAEETYRTISGGMAYASAGEIVEELKDLAKHHEP